MQFRTIVADPPWMESGGGQVKRGADRHYPLMKTRDIMALPVWRHVDQRSAHLYLWTTNNFLHDGIHVMEAWGFRYVTCVTWMKEGAPGLGQYFRGLTEHLLFGVTGRTRYRMAPDGKRAQGVTGIIAPRGRHSEKPEVFMEMIERVSEGPYLELFSRSAREGWRAWGNEAADDFDLHSWEEQV